MTKEKIWSTLPLFLWNELYTAMSPEIMRELVLIMVTQSWGWMSNFTAKLFLD
jgi:hypothetical protein